MRKGYMIPNNLFTEEELANFTDAELGHLFRAIIHASQGWEEIQTSREEGRIMREWKLFDELASKSYEASVENGKKGGRPKTKENLEKPNETQDNLEEPSVTQKNQYEYEDDNEYINKYTGNELLRAKIKEFLAHRKRIRKPVKDIKNLLTRLSKTAKTDEEQIQVLAESIENEWQGIFPLKKASGHNSKAEIIEHDYHDVTVNDPRKQYRK